VLFGCRSFSKSVSIDCYTRSILHFTEKWIRRNFITIYKKLNGLNDEECFSNVQFLHKNFSAGFGLAPTMRPLKARRGILYFAKKKRERWTKRYTVALHVHVSVRPLVGPSPSIEVNQTIKLTHWSHKK
jgi:hypothetical protein